jgi:hypothetical protein
MTADMIWSDHHGDGQRENLDAVHVFSPPLDRAGLSREFLLTR